MTEARILLQEDYEETWGESSPEMFRQEVSRKVVEKTMVWMGLVDGGKSQQNLYRSLYDKEHPKTDFGIFLTNALPLSDYSLMGVFPVINRINHACLPNCCVRWDKHSASLQLFSSQEIQAGTELTISYYDMLSHQPDRQSRQEYLSKHFYFTCNCSLCSITGEKLCQDDNNRREESLDRSLEFIINNLLTGQVVVSEFERLLP